MLCHSSVGLLVKVNRSPTQTKPFNGCAALLDTGSPQTLIRRDVLDTMLSVGTASITRGRKCVPRSWGDFGESAPLQTSTSVRLSVHLFRADKPTCSLAVWACVVPPSVMQHAVLLGRDSWMRFKSRSYRSLPLHRRTIGFLAN